MGVISETLGNHGAQHRIEYHGKTYRLSRVDQIVKSAFEETRFARSRKALELSKSALSPEEYKQRLDEKIAQFEAGEFEMFSESGVAYLKTVPGMRLLVSLLVGCDENELMGLVLEKKDELVPMIGLILRESFPGLVFAAKDETAESTPTTNGQPTTEIPSPNP